MAANRTQNGQILTRSLQEFVNVTIIKEYVVDGGHLDIWTTKSIQRSETYLNLPGQISVELEISVRPDLMCGCGCNSAWIELLPCEHCPPRACSGNWPRLSSGQFIAMLRLHLPLELPIRPQFIAAVFWLIHCHGPAAAIVTLPHGCGTASCISNSCD